MIISLLFLSTISLAFISIRIISAATQIFPSAKFNKHQIQVVYLTFKRLWNFWFLSKVFILKNFVIKSLRRIRLGNIQNRRLHGSSIKHGGFWDFLKCRASADDQSPDIPFEIRWILGNSIRPVSKPRFRGLKSINQSTGCSNNSKIQY